MGFCEMIYHETRNFPPEEKEGLAKELRMTSVKLLRMITIESIKSPKDFLNGLDKTVETQLDILLLLKLAFRLGYINKRAYQTLEEDLKGLEVIANNMRSMHGLPPARWSIHEKVHAQGEPQLQLKTTTRGESELPQKSPKSHMPEKKVPEKVGIKTSKAQGLAKSQDNVQIQPEVEKKQDVKVAVGKEFEGTPLFDEDVSVSEGKEFKQSEEEGSEKKIEKFPSELKGATEQKQSLKDEQKKAHSKGLWSLRRAIPKKQEKKSHVANEDTEK